jgi:hypothetical protein
MEDGGLDRGSGGKHIGPSREPRQRRNGCNLHGEPDRADDGEPAEPPHQATFASAAAGRGSAA